MAKSLVRQIDIEVKQADPELGARDQSRHRQDRKAAHRPLIVVTFRGFGACDGLSKHFRQGRGCDP